MHDTQILFLKEELFIRKKIYVIGLLKYLPNHQDIHH